jgi:hypothetical protein
MIELIALFSASYIAFFALLALALMVGSELVRRTRPEVPGDDAENDNDADLAGGAEDTEVAA